MRLFRGILFAGLIAVGAVTGVACYETPQPDCAFLCGDGEDDCPEDYGCASDGMCKRIDLPDDHACEEASAEAPAPTSDLGSPATAPLDRPARASAPTGG